MSCKNGNGTLAELAPMTAREFWRKVKKLAIMSTAMSVCPGLPGLQTAWVSVTPELAAWMMGRNRQNRNLGSRTTGIYTEDLVSGNWKTTHQGIAFGSTGVLRDGQHRLDSIVRADETAMLLVTYGLSEDAVPEVDRVKRRTVVNQMQISGDENVNSAHTSIANGMRDGCWKHISCKTDVATRNFIDEYRDAIDFSINQTRQQKGRKNPATAMVRAAIARSYYHVEEDTLVEFCDLLMTGICPSKKGEVVMTLREKLIMGKWRPDKGDGARQQIFSLTQTGIEHFMKSDFKKNLVPKRTNLFPINWDSLDSVRK